MIEESVSVQDKFSVEIVLGYNTKNTRKTNDFIVNTWIFFPHSLDINSDTYKKEDFYKDIKYNVRLITPSFLLRNFANAENSPIQHLRHALTDYASSPTRANLSNLEHHLKLFHSILKSSLRNESNLIKKNIKSDDFSYLVNEYIRNIQQIIEIYREMRLIIVVPGASSQAVTYYSLGDEFLSNMIERYTNRILQHIDFETPNMHPQEREKLISLLLTEQNYKKKKNFPEINKNSQDNNRELMHRWNVLKKYIESQLFLSIRKRKDGVITEQIIYSIAAGFAMFFATAVAFIFQEKYGSYTFPLFAALVVSYMVKDRLKELLRIYFSGKMEQKFFDHKNIIRLRDNQPIGWCKESFDFVSERKVPVEVVKRRNRSQIVEIEHRIGHEKIILYRKFLRLDRPALDKVFEQYTITGIKDIIRVNVTRYIRMMDNPTAPILHFNGTDLDTVTCERVYNLNLVLNFQYDGSTRFSRYRIKFNRDGIREIEKL